MMIEGIVERIGKNVIIQRKTVIEGDCSGDTVSWSTFANIRGAIKTVSGREIEVARKINIEATHKLYCEKVAVTELDRVLFENIYYRITYIENPMSMDDFLQIWLKRDDTYVNNSNQ